MRWAHHPLSPLVDLIDFMNVTPQIHNTYTNHYIIKDYVWNIFYFICGVNVLHRVRLPTNGIHTIYMYISVCVWWGKWKAKIWKQVDLLRNEWHFFFSEFDFETLKMRSHKICNNCIWCGVCTSIGAVRGGCRCPAGEEHARPAPYSFLTFSFANFCVCVCVNTYIHIYILICICMCTYVMYIQGKA